jgi:two-component system chemotaxis sensor kinase CheA
MNEYKKLFISESQEILRDLSHGVIALEKTPGRTEWVQNLFRGVHTLKGMAASMGYHPITEVSHVVESFLEAWKSGQIRDVSTATEIVLEAVDLLGSLVARVQKNGDLPTEGFGTQLAKLTTSISSCLGRKDAQGFQGIRNARRPRTASHSQVSETELRQWQKRTRGSELNLFEVSVALTPECQLPGARQMVVIHLLLELGELWEPEKAVADIRSGKTSILGQYWILTRLAQEKVREKVMALPDVQEVRVRNGLETGSSKLPQAKQWLSETHSIRVPIAQLDKLMNLVGELSIRKSRMVTLTSRLRQKELDDEVVELGRLASELQDEVMQTRLVPLEYLVSNYPRMIRDLSKTVHKTPVFEMQGTHIGVDRTILDEINDPLIHLLRNAVDHGIESAEERKTQGKSAEGVIRLSAARERNYVIIQVSDDGRGLHLDQIKQTALGKGIVSAADLEKMTDDQLFFLITHPMYSTAPKVTEISGRGVGMNVVRTQIEKMGGMLFIESQVGLGTTFRIKLPISMAIVQALLVGVAGSTFAIPLSSVTETLKIRLDQLIHGNPHPLVFYRGHPLVLVDLKRKFFPNSPRFFEKPFQGSAFSVVVAEGGAQHAGLVVDEFRGQQEVVVKSLQSPLRGIPGIAGATILGNGQVSMILDVGAYLKAG